MLDPTRRPISSAHPRTLARNSLDLDRKNIKNAKKNSEREHVGPYIENPKNNFLVGGIEPFLNHYNYRFTLDEKEDYVLLNEIFNKFDFSKGLVSIIDIIDFIDKNPQLKSINSHLVRNEGYLKSLNYD